MTQLVQFTSDPDPSPKMAASESALMWQLGEQVSLAVAVLSGVSLRKWLQHTEIRPFISSNDRSSSARGENVRASLSHSSTSALFNCAAFGLAPAVIKVTSMAAQWQPRVAADIVLLLSDIPSARCAGNMLCRLMISFFSLSLLREIY